MNNDRLPSPVVASLLDRPDAKNFPEEVQQKIIVDAALLRVHDQLRSIIAEPSNRFVVSVTGVISALGTAFHAQLRSVPREGVGWAKGVYGAELMKLNEEGNVLAAQSLLKVTEAVLNRLRSEVVPAKVQFLEKEVQEGLKQLEVYQQARFPVDANALTALKVSYETWKESNKVSNSPQQ